MLDAVQTAYAGATVGQTYAGIRTVDVVVLLPDKRHQPAELAKLMIASPFGPVPLSQVAQSLVHQDRYSIDHDGGQRRVSVTFNVVGGASLQSVVQDGAAGHRPIREPAARRLCRIHRRRGGGSADRNELMLYTGFALVLIGMILFVCFHWRANTWLVLVNLPFSLIGSVAAIAVTGLGLSLGAMVGLVTVFGVSARNAILLLAHYEHLVEVEGAPWSVDLVLRGAQERLVPILMTAAVTALGLVPLAIGMQSAGPGNRRPDGGDGAGRLAVIDPAEPGGAAGPGAALRPGRLGLLRRRGR